MRKIGFIAFIFLLSACTRFKTKSTHHPHLEKAKTYLGTPYKMGGINRKGLDCSGLVYVSFLDAGHKLPRTAKDQAKIFNEIKEKEIKIGDLLYFIVGSKSIDHTGIVAEKKSENEIIFIHSSSSKGVRMDNLYSKYWYSKFVKACRPNLD